jgi:hypothetical protein
VKKAFKEKLLSFEFWWWLGLIIFALLLHGNHVMNNDEGVVLEGAWNLLQGKELYLDFFEFVTPGSFYLIFLFWKFFGAHYFIANIIAIGALFIGSIGVYRIAELINRSKVNYLIPAIIIFSSFQWPIINHNLFSATFIIWATFFFLKGLQIKKNKYFIYTGLLIGFATLFLQSKGLAVLFGTSSFLAYLFFKEKKIGFLKKNSLLILAAIAPVTILFFAWPVKVLYINLVEFVLLNYKDVNRISLFYFFLFLLILIVSFIILRKEKKLEVNALLWLQFVLLLSTLSRPDSYHVALSIFPLLSLSFFIPIKLDPKKRLSKKVYKICFVGLMLLFIYPSIKYVTGFPIFYSIKDQGAIGYVKENCQGERSLFAGPFIPGIYFETGKVNPTPFGWLITNHQTKEQFNQARKILEEKKPRCVVTHYGVVKKFDYNRDNPVDNFIKKEYHEVYREEDMVVYMKTLR